MFPLLLLAAICYPLYHTYCLLRNIQIARSTGLPYLILPFNQYSLPWIVLGRALYPLLATLLPFFPRLRWIRPDWFWARKYAMYREVGADVFAMVSASGVFIVVCDADVVVDVLARKDDFPKPPVVHPGLDIYGRNVVTTSGAEWRRHRKVVTPHFGESYNRLAWTKGVEKTSELVKHWSTRLPHETDGPVLRNVENDFIRLTMNITTHNMFGTNLRWPNRIAPSSQTDDGYDEDGPPNDEVLAPNHKMSYQASIKHMLNNCNMLMVAPSWYLKWTPNATHRKAGVACRELGVYLNEMVDEKRREMSAGTARGGDLITALIRSEQGGEKGLGADKGLTKQEVIGETFMLIFTGHATTANALHNTITMLAIYPEYQIKLQEDLDRILGDRVPEYENDYPALAESWAGAIFHEINRLYPALPLVPKFTPSPQYITVNGTKHLIPAHTPVLLDCCNTQRNPKYWVPPHETEAVAAPDEFRPQRWLNAPGESQNTNNPNGNFLKPYKGSYYPWSDGQRVCLGKKYSVVELLAIYAEVFRGHSVELDVGAGETWEEARGRAKRYMERVDSGLLLKTVGKEPGVRYVKRGEERFFPRR